MRATVAALSCKRFVAGIRRQHNRSNLATRPLADPVFVTTGPAKSRRRTNSPTASNAAGSCSQFSMTAAPVPMTTAPTKSRRTSNSATGVARNAAPYT